jgi:hypothetical protein
MFEAVCRLKDSEKENERLPKAVSDLMLKKLIIRQAASGTEGPSSENSERSRRRRCLDHVITNVA